MEQTPIQKGIDDIPMIFGNDNRITQKELTQFLQSLLPYEKQFMQGVFDAGASHSTDTSDFPMGDKLKNNFPDFETLYSQFNP